MSTSTVGNFDGEIASFHQLTAELVAPTLLVSKLATVT